MQGPCLRFLALRGAGARSSPGLVRRAHPAGGARCAAGDREQAGSHVSSSGAVVGPTVREHACSCFVEALVPLMETKR